MATYGRTQRIESQMVCRSTVRVWTVRVTWAFQHPPSPENSAQSTVIVAAKDASEAQLIAAQMVSCRRECVMPTRSRIVRTDP